MSLIKSKRFYQLLVIFCLMLIGLKIYRSNQPKDIDYANLEKLLSIQDWESADYETSKIMQEITDQSRPLSDKIHNSLTLNQFHRPIIVNEIPCEDLLTIDKLWTEYSENRLGFTAQRAMLKPLDSKLKTLNDVKLNKKFREILKWETYYSAHGADKERSQENNQTHYQKVKNIPVTAISYGYLPYKLYSNTYSLKVANSWAYYDMPSRVISTAKKVEECSKK